MPDCDFILAHVIIFIHLLKDPII